MKVGATTISVCLLCLILFCFSLSAAKANNQAPQASSPTLGADLTLPPGQKTWTLPRLTALALSINPTTRLAWAQVGAAAANVGIVESAYWPQLGVNISTGWTTHQNGNNNNNNSSNNNSNNNNGSNNNNFGCSSSNAYCANLTLNYLVWDFGATHQAVKNAKYQLIATQLTQNESFQQVILQVEQAYYQLLGQQALVEADKISLEEAKTNLQAARALHQQGLSTIGDVYQAESNFAQAVLTLQQAQGNLSIAHGQLATAIGLPVQTYLVIADVPHNPEDTSIMRSVTILLNKAKNDRPDLAAAQAQVAAAQAQVQVTEDQQWPTISLSASTSNSNIFTTFATLNRQSNVMLTINYPLFTGFEQREAVRQAQAQEQEAQATQAQLANQIEIQVWQAYYALDTAHKSIATSRAYLKTSIQAANQSLGQYKAGVGNILSVLTTQTTEASARVQLIQSVLNWYLALAQLMQAIGALQVP